MTEESTPNSDSGLSELSLSVTMIESDSPIDPPISLPNDDLNEKNDYNNDDEVVRYLLIIFLTIIQIFILSNC